MITGKLSEDLSHHFEVHITKNITIDYLYIVFIFIWIKCYVLEEVSSLFEISCTNDVRQLNFLGSLPFHADYNFVKNSCSLFNCIYLLLIVYLSFYLKEVTPNLLILTHNQTITFYYDFIPVYCELDFSIWSTVCERSYILCYQNKYLNYKSIIWEVFK